MAVNDITRILDYQPRNQTEVALPEPTARREPSEYRKALSRSVTPRGTAATQKPHPEKTRAYRNGGKENSAAESVQESIADSATEIEQSETQKSSDSGSDTKDKPSVITNKKTGEITPPSSLRELFPNLETDSPSGEKSHPRRGQDAGLQPPKGLALSLQGQNKQDGQNEVRTPAETKSKSGPVPWNEALWTKPVNDGNSQDVEQVNASTEGTTELLNKPQIETDFGGEIITTGEAPGNKDSDRALPESEFDSQVPTIELGGTPNEESVQQSVVQNSVSHDKSTLTASAAEQRSEESAVAITQIEASDGRQTVLPVEGNERNRSVQPAEGTQSGHSSVTFGLQNSPLNSPAASGPERIAPAVNAAVSVAENIPEKAPGGSSNLPETGDANITGKDGLQDAGIKPATTPGQPVVNGSTKTGSASSISERIGIAEQAADAARGAIEQNRPFRVRLNPPELGTLQVEITQRDGVYSARLEVQNSTAQQALLDHIEQLKGTLQQSGIRLDRVDVQLSSAATDDRSSDGSEFRQQQHETPQDSREDNRRRRQSDDNRPSHHESSQDGQREQSEHSDQVDVQI